jgi:RNA polymerase sigma-70 factor (ECF subfamily)
VICHILFDVGFFASRAVEPLDPRVERAAAGDRAALVSLYREHFSAVHTFAERLLGCPMAADDLVHEVFLALPGALGRFRGQCALGSYLLSITVRRARQHLRGAQRRREGEARAASAGAERLAPAPDADAERRELARCLSQALDELPLSQRAAFVLCEVEERSSQEAGEILGEKPGTVRARVFQAKRRLRVRLEELVPDGLRSDLERSDLESSDPERNDPPAEVLP